MTISEFMTLSGSLDRAASRSITHGEDHDRSKGNDSKIPSKEEWDPILRDKINLLRHQLITASELSLEKRVIDSEIKFPLFHAYLEL